MPKFLKHIDAVVFKNVFYCRVPALQGLTLLINSCYNNKRKSNEVDVALKGFRAIAKIYVP